MILAGCVLWALQNQLWIGFPWVPWLVPKELAAASLIPVACL